MNREHQRIALAGLIAVGLHQPPFDLQPTDAREPERVGGNHRDLLEQRIVERREPAFGGASERSHVQLGPMGDVAGRIGERTSIETQGEAAQLTLSRGDLTNRASCGRHREQMHVAAGLGEEVDRVAIGRPGGTAGDETPVSREISSGPSACWNGADVGRHPLALRAHECDRLFIGRPGGRAALGETGGEGARRASSNVEEEQRRPVVVLHLLIFRGVLLEGDRLAVRRPGRRGLTQIAARELARGAAGERHEIQMAGAAGLARRQVAALIADDRNRGVHAPVETLGIGGARDCGRRDTSAPRLLLHAVRVIAAPRVGQPLPVAREDRHRVHALDLECFAARRSGPEKPDVVIRALAFARKREQGTVGRPVWIGRFRRGAGVAERRPPARPPRAVGGRHPDLVVAPVLVFDDGGHDEGDAPGVGRQRRTAHDGQPIVVGGLPGTGLGGQSDRRTDGQNER